MLPRIEAQRELASINALTAAMGGMRRMDRQRYLSRLQRTARGEKAGAAAQASPEALAAMGVNVVIKEASGG